MPEGARFVDELLQALPVGTPGRAALVAVLRKWSGGRVYVHSFRERSAAARSAQRLVDAGVHQANACAILAEQHSITRRHARRLVAAARRRNGEV
jgi:hypothetical protein